MAAEATRGSRLLPAHSPSNQLVFQTANLIVSSPSLPSFKDPPLPVEKMWALNEASEDQHKAALPTSPASCSLHQPRCSKGPHVPHLE